VSIDDTESVIRLPMPSSSLRFDQNPDTLAMLRSAPLQKGEFPDGTSGWLVTGYSEVREVLTSTRFSRALAVSPERSNRGIDAAAAAESLLGMDPPAHTRLRKLVVSAFTSRRVNALRPRIATIVCRLLDEFIDQGSPGDLIQGFALALPVEVICELLGVPASDVGDFQKWSSEAVGVWEHDQEKMMGAWTSMGIYIADLINVKRRQPADDLMSALIAARDGEEKLTEMELIQLGVTLLVGGYETTGNQLALSLLTLFTHPKEWARLQADLGLIPSAVEELLRYVRIGGGEMPPGRVAVEDVRLADVTVRAGELVWPLMDVANRDPAVFPDPDRLDLSRDGRPHLALGDGMHRCLGAQLAKVELQEAFRGVLVKLPGLRLATPIEDLRYREQTAINSLYEMPVAWDGPS
jgi:cytochrome P450